MLQVTDEKVNLGTKWNFQPGRKSQGGEGLTNEKQDNVLDEFGRTIY